MEQSVFLPAKSRGNTDIGWLNGHHSFNFGNFYNANRNAFGPLVILNDDVVAPGKGFGTHFHANMEIISIPISGSITHADSTGKKALIHTGDVQMMSAGKGISHSEYNEDHSHALNFLQIWIQPKIKDIEPRYQQISTQKFMPNTLTEIVSPLAGTTALHINQDAWLSIGNFSPGKSLKYTSKNKNNGLYIFLISGEVLYEKQMLEAKDALKLWGKEEFLLNFTEQSQILFIEVPLN